MRMSSHHLTGTNTYLIGKGAQRILIDSGEGQAKWFQLVQEALRKENAMLSTVLITHWHPDHVGGVKDLLTLSPQPKVYKHNPERNIENDIQNDQTFSVDDGQTVLRAVHSPGHTNDHMAFVLEQEDAMFTGDNVLGHGTAVFEDLATYLSTLEMMATKAQGRGYPGHGESFASTPSRIREYIEHRRKREREVVEVLGAEEEDKGWSSMDIVKKIYVEVPESLHLAAQRGIVQILDKLTDEGRVVHDGEAGTWKLAEKATL